MSEQDTWCAQVPFNRVVSMIYLPVDDLSQWVRELGTVEAQIEGTASSDPLEPEARPKLLAWPGKLCREQIRAGVRGPIILAAPNNDF